MDFFKLLGSVVAVLALMALIWVLLTPVSFGGHGIWGWIVDILAAILQVSLLLWVFKKIYASKKGDDNTLRF